MGEGRVCTFRDEKIQELSTGDGAELDSAQVEKKAAVRKGICQREKSVRNGREGRVRRRTWALVTGAIRNDLYLRVVLIKLCGMRAENLIEEIVLSTWKNEIDVFEGLRKELEELDIIVVESPYINEEVEGKFNQLIYARQREAIAQGLKVIPNGCFVFKLRTDYLHGIYGFLKNFEEDRLELDTKRYGAFRILYDYKLVLTWYNSEQLLFCNDRYFYGYKSDLEKVNAPMAYYKFAKFGRFAENELLNGIAFLCNPILRSVWDILPAAFYTELSAVCKGVEDRDLNLPRIVYRIYATVLVYVYTHISFAGRYETVVESADRNVKLAELFQNRIRTDHEVMCLVMGRIESSDAAEAFKEELRKIALDLPEVKQYTYEEYEELRQFVVEKLKKPELIAEYPYDRRKRAGEKTGEKGQAGNILLAQYGDRETAQKITDAMEHFNSVGTDLYEGLVYPRQSRLGFALCKGAVFDRNRKAMYEYLRTLLEDEDKYDDYTWTQVGRNLRMCFRGRKLEKETLASVYLFLKAGRKLSIRDSGVLKIYDEVLINLEKSDFGKMIDFHGNKGYGQDKGYLENLITFLDQRAGHGLLGGIEIEIVRALLMLRLEENPFTAQLLSELVRQNRKDELKQIEEIYGAEGCSLSDYMVSNKIRELEQRWRTGKIDISKVMESARTVTGRKDSWQLVKLLLGEKWNQPREMQGAVDMILEELLVKCPVESAWLRDLNGLSWKQWNIGEEELVLMLQLLQEKHLLKENVNAVRQFCGQNRHRTLLLEAFLRLEADERLRYFSMKNAVEVWLNYVPFLETEWNKKLTVPKRADGISWPWADRNTGSAFASYIRVRNSTIYLSIELCAEERDETEKAAVWLGTDIQNKAGSGIIRLCTAAFPFEGIREIGIAVNLALDEFCKLGNRLMKYVKEIG